MFCLERYLDRGRVTDEDEAWIVIRYQFSAKVGAMPTISITRVEMRVGISKS